MRNTPAGLVASMVGLAGCFAGSALAQSTPTSSKATFGVSGESWFPDAGYDNGFLAGLRGFEHFYEPLGNPIYFESPFVNTGLRFLFLRHTFADGSTLAGGDLTVYAMQARLAITERLAFIATKDGYSDLQANALPEDTGWNDLAAGLKYAFYVDRDNDAVATAGLRYQIDSGDEEVLQGGVGEFSPFVSAAIGFDQLHLIGNATLRLPTNNDDGNTVFQWSLHADYEIAPDSLPGFAPIFELHGLHYLSDGERSPFDVGGLDYTNLGSTDVSGSTVVWAGVGGRYKFSPNVSVGLDYEFPLTNQNADIFGDRITLDLHFTY